MSRTLVAVVGAVAVALSLSACAAGGHPGAVPSARPHPT